MLFPVPHRHFTFGITTSPQRSVSIVHFGCGYPNDPLPFYDTEPVNLSSEALAKEDDVRERLILRDR